MFDYIEYDSINYIIAVSIWYSTFNSVDGKEIFDYRTNMSEVTEGEALLSLESKLHMFGINISICIASS